MISGEVVVERLDGVKQPGKVNGDCFIPLFKSDVIDLISKRHACV